MAKTKVLIVVKTYPALSSKYDELVCTAGFKEDGSWIRIYPIHFRELKYEKQYRKYQWIEIDLEKNPSDPRPESFRPRSYDTIKPLDKIDYKHWENRKEIVLKNVYNNLDEIIDKAHKDLMSLAVFKPEKILDFVVEKTERVWDSEKLKRIIAKRNQISLFPEKENYKELPKKLPYKFSYLFEDINGRQSTLMIEDWEIGQLYWNCLEKYNGDEQKAIQKIHEKYFENFVKTKDLYLFLGTTREYHIRKAKNPYVIIGVFYPPKIEKQNNLQISMFD